MIPARKSVQQQVENSATSEQLMHPPPFASRLGYPRKQVFYDHSEPITRFRVELLLIMIVMVMVKTASVDVRKVMQVIVEGGSES